MNVFNKPSEKYSRVKRHFYMVSYLYDYLYIISRFQIAIDVETIIIGHVLNKKNM